jgi:hypothetical protein
MESIIFRYINADGDVPIAIGSYRFYRDTAKVSRQIITTLGREHTEEMWKQLTELSNSELLDVLEAMLDQYEIYCEHPS